MLSRLFAILAAVFLVMAVAIAALVPATLPLGQGLLQIDRTLLDWLRDHSFPWLWRWIELPFLLRPAWLLPACAGIICAGLAASFNLAGTSSSRRRRS